MTNQETNSILALLQALPQPVFCVQDGSVSFCNLAAQEQLVRTGEPVTAYLCQDDGLYDSITPDMPAHLSVRLAGKRYSASVHDLGGVRVFLVEAPDSDTLRADTLLSVSRGMTGALTSLFASAESFFPILEEAENDEYQRHMSEMNRAMYQLLRLRCNLTDMYAAMSGELRLHREKVEIVPYFDDLFYQLRHLCLDAGVQLDTTLPPRIFPGWIDKQRVEQLILMLLSNALKYAEKGDTLSLRVDRMGERILIRLSDNGAGMDAGILSTAFSRYDRTVQLEDARNGVGLGLPIVRHIAQLHGGAVMLQAAPDGGTCVSVSLSIKAPDEAERSLKSPVAAMDYAGGFRHDLIELSVVLPRETYDTRNID